MKERQVFVFTYVITAAVFTAAIFVGADEQDEKKKQMPVATAGTVMVDSCKVTARLVAGERGIDAVVAVSNPTDTDATISLNYMAQNTPPTSPYARMMVLPQTSSEGTCELTVAAGDTVEKTITVKEGDEGIDLSTSGTWTFVVSREKIAGPVLGAGLPAVADEAPVLETGHAVIATLQMGPAIKATATIIDQDTPDAGQTS